MSAGGLSYSGLRTSAKVTLPSVESWNTNMNILRDPVKSIFTRRKDKVGDTQEILLAQEDSGDRIAECINVYARGVNPMVSVSYDNYGNNAGMRSSISQKSGGVKLPYKPEVFYPPVFRQEDLVPLSRQPRTWFYALSNPELPGIIQEMKCPETKSSINPSKPSISANTPLQYKYDRPVEILTNKPSNSIQQNTLKLSTRTNPNSYPISSLPPSKPQKIRNNILHYPIISSKSGNKHTPLLPNLTNLNAIHKNSLLSKSSHSSNPISFLQNHTQYPLHLDSKHINDKKLQYPVHSSLSSNRPNLNHHLPPKFTLQTLLNKGSYVPNHQRLDSSSPWIHSKIPTFKSKTFGHDVFSNKQSNIKPSPWLHNTQHIQQKRNLPLHHVDTLKHAEDSYTQWYQDTKQATAIQSDLLNISTEGTLIFPEKNEWLTSTSLDTVGQQKPKQKLQITNTESIFNKNLQPSLLIYDDNIQSTSSRNHTYSHSRSNGEFEPSQQSIPSVNRLYDYANQKATHNKHIELRKKANSYQ